MPRSGFSGRVRLRGYGMRDDCELPIAQSNRRRTADSLPRARAPRSRKRRTSSGVLYAAIPPLTPRNNFAPAGSSCLSCWVTLKAAILSQSLRRRVFAALTLRGATQEQNRGVDLSQKAVPLAACAYGYVGRIITRVKNAQIRHCFPQRRWSCWRFYITGTPGKDVMTLAKRYCSFWVAGMACCRRTLRSFVA